MPYLVVAQKQEYQRKWRQERRNKWIEENGPCRECGSNIDLEVDHIDPTKKISHRIWSLAEKRRNEELAKCQVLCKECHKKKTSTYRANALQHGTTSMYNMRSCRCIDCTAANRDYRRKYREHNRQ